jgi:hypothetical protein
VVQQQYSHIVSDHTEQGAEPRFYALLLCPAGGPPIAFIADETGD